MPESPDLHPLFVQLQTRYPTSGLLTELVQIHADHFVVRALVQLGNVTLATSLAAATTVEQAEDQARLRVLAMVGIRPVTLPTLPDLSFSAYEAIAQRSAEPLDKALSLDRFDAIGREGFTAPSLSPVDATIAPPSPAPPLPAFLVEPAATETPAIAVEPHTPVYETESGWDEPDEPDPSDTLSEPDSLEPDSLEPDSFEPETLKEPEPSIVEQAVATVSEVPTSTIASKQGAKSKPRQSNVGKETSASESPSTASRDLSSLISQIGVEIDRIGWSKRQGSTYLQKTYGKKTRSELTDDELEDFLTYLNTQPSASEPLAKE